MRSSLTMGAACAAIGAAAGALVVRGATGEGYGWFMLAAPMAAFLTGSAAWWWLVARPNRRGLVAGVFAGVLAALGGHFLCWYLMLASAWACYALTGGCTASLGLPPMNPLQALAGAAVYSGLSLVFIGWFTVPAGALVGGLLARARRKTGP